jgi:hypothetical protein
LSENNLPSRPSVDDQAKRNGDAHERGVAGKDRAECADDSKRSFRDPPKDVRTLHEGVHAGVRKELRIGIGDFRA